MNSYLSTERDGLQLHSADNSQSTVEDPDLYKDLVRETMYGYLTQTNRIANLDKVPSPERGDTGSNGCFTEPLLVGAQQHQKVPSRLYSAINDLYDFFPKADDVRAWIDELRREVAQQSERINVLEQKNSKMTRVLADYERCFKLLGQIARERKVMLKSESKTKGEVEEDTMETKRKRVQFS